MKEFKTNEIRNIALIGAAKSGKTTLAENMLFEGKVINRKEARKKRTRFPTIVPSRWSVRSLFTPPS